MKKYLLIGAAVILIGIGSWFVMNQKPTVFTSTQGSNNTATSTSTLTLDQAVEIVYGLPAIKNWKSSNGSSSLYCGDQFGQDPSSDIYTITCSEMEKDGHHATLGIYKVNKDTGQVVQ